MKPLLFVVATLIASAAALPENIDDVKQLPQSHEPIVEAEESEPQARKERCTTCTGLNLSIKGPNEVLAAIQALPGAEVHTQQSYESCSSDKGCAGLKVKDGRVVEKFGNVDSFKAAAAADAGNEFQFHAGGAVFEGGVPNGGPFWWMNEQNSPFKNAAGGAGFEKFSKSSSSFSTTGTGGQFNAGVDLAANPFLNGDFSKLGNFGGADKNGFSSSSYESSFSTTGKGDADLAKNPFLNGGIKFGQAGATNFAGASGLASSQSSGKFGGSYTGSSPSPFTATAGGSNVNLIQNNQKASEFDYEQSQQQQSIDEAFQATGNVLGHEHTGGDFQQTCAGQGYVCVHKAQCNNGVVNSNGANVLQAKTQKQYCNTRTEICCRIEVSTLSGAGSLQGSLGVGSATFQGSQGSGLFVNQGQGQSGSGSSSFGAQGSQNAFGQSGQSGQFGANGFANNNRGFGQGSQTAQGSSTFESSSSSFGSNTASNSGTGFQSGSSGNGFQGSNNAAGFGGSFGASGSSNNFNKKFGSGAGNTGFSANRGSGSNEVFKSTSQSNFVETDSFSSGSEAAGVFSRPFGGGPGLKPGIPYLPPDNINQPSIISSTVVPTTFTTQRPYTPRPTTPRPVYIPSTSTAAPGYLPPEQSDSSNTKETRIPGPVYNDGSLILDATRTTARPFVPPSEIPAGCAAALKCTPVEYCTAEGVISNTTVVLTRDQEAYRVPLTDCKHLESGVIGKCCRDPLYTDPWPTNQLGKWVPNVFGGNDGKYVPDSKNSGSNRPIVTVRPPTTGQIYLNNNLPPKPTPGPGLTSFAQKGQFEQRGQGQFGTRGQGSFTQGGSAVSQGSQSQFSSQGTQNKFTSGGQGQIGTGRVGITASRSQSDSTFSGTQGLGGLGVGFGVQFGGNGQNQFSESGSGTNRFTGSGGTTQFSGSTSQTSRSGTSQSGSGPSQFAGGTGQFGGGTSQFGSTSQFSETDTTQFNGNDQRQFQGVIPLQTSNTGQSSFSSETQTSQFSSGNQNQFDGNGQGQFSAGNSGQGQFAAGSNSGQSQFSAGNSGQTQFTGGNQGQFAAGGGQTQLTREQSQFSSGTGVQSFSENGGQSQFAANGGQSQFSGQGQTGGGLLAFGGQGQQAQGSQFNNQFKGQGQIVSQGQGQYTEQGQGGFAQGGGGQFGIGGQGQIGIGGAGGQGQFTKFQESSSSSQTFGQGGQGVGVSQGGGALVSQGGGAIVSQGGGAVVSQGGGFGVNRGQGAAVSQGGGALVGQGGGGLLSQGGLGFGIQGGGAGLGIGFGTGVRQGFGQGVIQGQGAGFSQGFGSAIKQGFGQAIIQGEGQSASEEVYRVFLGQFGGNGQCGIMNGQKPYGNRNDLEVDFAEIPWQAMVLLQTNRSLLCGGVITRPDVVITSAACVEGLEAKNVLIKGGEWKLGIDDEPLPFQIVQVKHILRHPFYKTGSLKYDAAILVLTENLRLAKNIFPICLPGATETLDAFYNGAGECIVTGWGRQVLQAHLEGAIMHSLNVSLINPGECESKLSQDYPHLLEQYDQESCACGQPLNPVNNICKVDTGSALACTTDNVHYVLRGVYSWDSGCQTGNQLAAFYKFDLEWYQWAIGQIESTRFASYSGSSKVTQNRFSSQLTSVKGGNQYTGVKGGAIGGVKGFASSSASSGSIKGGFNGAGVGSGSAQFGASGAQLDAGSGQFGAGNGQFGTSGTGQFGFTQFGQSSKFIDANTGSSNFGAQIKGPISNSFSATYSEKKVFQTEPKIITYTTKPEIVTFTTKPEYYTFTTKPKIVTYTTKPQIITYETSGSGTNPQYVAPGVTFNPSFSEIAGHRHNAQCKCLEKGKK